MRYTYSYDPKELYPRVTFKGMMYRILGWIWRLCEFCLGFRTYTVLNVDTPPEPVENGYTYKVSFENVKVSLFWLPMFVLDKKWAPRLFTLRGKMFPIKVVYK